MSDSIGNTLYKEYGDDFLVSNEKGVLFVRFGNNDYYTTIAGTKGDLLYRQHGELIVVRDHDGIAYARVADGDWYISSLPKIQATSSTSLAASVDKTIVSLKSNYPYDDIEPQYKIDPQSDAFVEVEKGDRNSTLSVGDDGMLYEGNAAGIPNSREMQKREDRYKLYESFVQQAENLWEKVKTKQVGNDTQLTDDDFEAGYQRIVLYDGMTYVRARYEDGKWVIHPDDMQLVQESNQALAKSTLIGAMIPGLFKVVGAGGKSLYKVFTQRSSKAIPRGFSSESQVQQCTRELEEALAKSGLDVKSIQVRGSSATGVSSKGGEFRMQPENGLKSSDIDVGIEFKNLINNITTSKNQPGFLHPNKMMKNFPELKAWSEKWSNILGREITPGGWQPGTLPYDPSNIHLK